MPLPELAPAPIGGLAVDLGGLRFNQGADSNGVQWYLTAIEGWDSPALRDDIEDRALAHGSYRGQSFYGQREITLTGTLLSPNGLFPLRAAKDELAYETDLTDVDGLLTVHETPAKQALVRRSGSPRFSQRRQHLLDFQIELTAVDPRKYAAEPRTATLTPGQTAAAQNAGTFRGGTPIRAAFHGPLTGVLLTAPSGSAGLTTVAAGEVVTVDALEGSVLAGGGSSAYGRLSTSAPLPTIPARTDGAVTLTGSGSGHVVLTWRDAWI